MINRKFKNEFNISFEPFLQKKECLVNATEMANVFGKLVKDYLKTEKTQAFLKVLEEELGNKKIMQKNGFQKDTRPFEESKNDDFSGEFSENILKVVKGGRNSGTWMHRFLAIDFAMWLDPYFKYWVISIVEEILFGHAKIQDACLREKLELQDERENILKKEFKTPEDFKRYYEIDLKINELDSTKRKSQNQKVQQFRMDLFDQHIKDENS